MLQPGRELVAAGYALYSSAVMLVLSWGEGVHGFTLDTGSGEFVWTHPDIQVPDRGESLAASGFIQSSDARIVSLQEVNVDRR